MKNIKAVGASLCFSALLLCGCAGKSEQAPVYYTDETSSATAYSEQKLSEAVTSAAETAVPVTETEFTEAVTASTEVFTGRIGDICSATTVSSADIPTAPVTSEETAPPTVTEIFTEPETTVTASAPENTAPSVQSASADTKNQKASEEIEETDLLTASVSEIITAPAVTEPPAEPAETEDTSDTSKKKIKYVTYEEYFANSLFVGDSICSGLKIYGGLLKTENVAARLNVSTWGIDKYTFQYKSNSTAELDAFSIAKMYQPEDIFIWMGMNDLYVVSEEQFGKNLCDLADRFLEVSPNSRIHVVSISPMTQSHKWNRELDGNNRVNQYNAAAEKACAEKENLDWINVHDALIDSNGFLASNYNGGDGLHLSADAYKVVLNEIFYYMHDNY